MNVDFRKILLRHFVTFTFRTIRFTEEKDGGTQIKMTMQYDNGMLAVAKPMRSVYSMYIVYTYI